MDKEQIIREIDKAIMSPVSQEDALDILEYLKDEIDSRRDALRDDLNRNF
jgi:hypothetical protein